MDIDIYQQCPCHSEKKIKFCCGKDIVTDLNQVLGKSSGGQTQAALEQLERIIAKKGSRDCLLTIQTHLLITSGDIPNARIANEQFLAKNPGHTAGLQHRALIELAEGDVAKAVNTLQDAMDAIPGADIPVSLANAFRLIGMGLLGEGHIVGARAHFIYALNLKNGNDDEIRSMVNETFRLHQAPLILKSNFYLAPLPESESDTEWAKKYSNALQLVERGQFRKSLKYLKKIDSLYPEHPFVVRGIAVMQMALGNLAELPESWMRYSQMGGLSEIEAIEANMLSHTFSSEPHAELIDVVRVTFELTETDGPLEADLSHPRLDPLGQIQEDPLNEGPPPRNGFLILDREPVSSTGELTLQNIASNIGELFLYGKQTDRPARLEWISAENVQFDKTKQELITIFGDWLNGDEQKVKISQTDAISQALTWNWKLPDDMTMERHAELMKEKCTEALLRDWSELKLDSLNNKTPHEAAEIPELRTALQANLLHLEFSMDGQFQRSGATDALRSQLKLPAPQPIELSEIGDRDPTPIEQAFLRLDNLSNEELLGIHARAMMIGNVHGLKRIVPAVLERPEIDSEMRELLFSTMAHLTDDTDEALDNLAKARSEAKQNGRPVGLYLVQEFEYRLSRGLTEQLPQLLKTIQLHHFNEPEVELQLSRVLQRHGLLQTEPGAGAEALSGAPLENEDSTTPQIIGAPSQSQDNESSESDPPSKLWIPD